MVWLPKSKFFSMTRYLLFFLTTLFAVLVCSFLHATEITKPEVIRVGVDYPQIVSVGSIVSIKIQVHPVEIEGSETDTREPGKITEEADITIEIKSENPANADSVEPHTPLTQETLSSGETAVHQYSYTFNKLKPVHLSYQIKYTHPKRKDAKLISLYYIPSETGELIVTDAETYQNYVSTKARDSIINYLEIQRNVSKEESGSENDSGKIQKRMKLPPDSHSQKSDAIIDRQSGILETATEKSGQRRKNLMQDTEESGSENDSGKIQKRMKLSPNSHSQKSDAIIDRQSGVLETATEKPGQRRKNLMQDTTEEMVNENE